MTVDPDRDSKEKIEKFISHFDNQFITVTGKNNNDPELVSLMKKFKIYATKIEFKE